MIAHVLETLLRASSFQAFPPLECAGAKIKSMGYEEKGSGINKFRWSNFVLGEYRKIKL